MSSIVSVFELKYDLTTVKRTSIQYLVYGQGDEKIF